MSQKDRHRVEQANALYMHMANFCVFLNAIQIPWTIENPTSSWLCGAPVHGAACRDLLLCFLSLMCLRGIAIQGHKLFDKSSSFLDFL